MKILILYIIAQSICVVTSTIKSVVLIKGSKGLAVGINTFHYIINSTLTYVIGRAENLTIWMVILITGLTNLIGVWVGLTITEKMKKERLWRISGTVKTENYEKVINNLKEKDIKFVTYETDWDKIKLIDVFSQGKEQSKEIKKIFENYKVKYTITDSHYSL